MTERHKDLIARLSYSSPYTVSDLPGPARLVVKDGVAPLDAQFVFVSVGLRDEVIAALLDAAGETSSGKEG